MVRPSWFAARRLQSQLLIWTAVILIVSVVVTQEVRTRRNIRLLEQNLRERSEQLITAVDKSLRLQSAPDPAMVPSLEQRLSEFIEADRTLTRLDVVKRQGNQTVVVASSSRMPELLLHTIPPGIVTEIRNVGSERMMVTTLAADKSDYGLIAVSSLRNIDQYEDFNRNQTPAFAAILILIVIGLMHVMYRRTVSRRFDELLEGIQRARTGQAAHIPEHRQDEIGIIAKTLNGLLSGDIDNSSFVPQT